MTELLIQNIAKHISLSEKETEEFCDMFHPRTIRKKGIVVGAVGALFFGGRLNRSNNLLFIFDALGLGLFTLIGIQKGMRHDLAPAVCVALGTITGCFGGVIRDVFLNKVPLIFQKEIYASASIGGGILYFLLTRLSVSSEPAAVISIFVIFIIRMLAVRFNWHLPVWNYAIPPKKNKS